MSSPERDLFEGAIDDTLKSKSEFGKSGMSGGWGIDVADIDLATRSEHKLIDDLLKIRNAVSNIIRIHGAPAGTIVKLAGHSDTIAGKAYFKDVRNKKGGVVSLDKSQYKVASTFKEALDLYCGLALHEVEHLNISGDLYDYCNIAGPDKLLKLLLNIIEDFRIESSVIQKSPGYAGYIHLIREKIIGVKTKQGIADFDSMNNKSKLLLIIFIIARVPELLNDKLKSVEINGDNLFALVRKVLDKEPKTAKDVIKQAQDLYKLILDLEAKADSLKAPEPPKPEEKPKEKPEEKPDEKSEEKIDTKPEEKLEDESDTESGDEPSEDSDSDDSDESDDSDDSGESDDSDESGDAKGEDSGEDSGEEDEGTGGKTIDAEAAPSGLEGEASEKETSSSRDTAGSASDCTDTKAPTKSFTVEDIEEMEKSFSDIDADEVLSSVEEKLVSESEEDNYKNAEDSWEYGGDTRLVKVEKGKPNIANHKLFSDFIRPHVVAARSIFKFRLAERTIKRAELIEGRLHRKMLSKAMMTERIFYDKHTVKAEGLAVCLLLDESGSMGRPYISGDRCSPAGSALAIGMLFAGALKKIPAVELEIYSYGSCGSGHEDCLVKYLYGRQQADIKGISGYVGSAQNYDHVAIKTAGKLFMQNTTLQHKLMIVLSDGEPSGNGYGGPVARKMTRDEVKKLEKQGIHVVQVAITNFSSEDMFSHVIRFTDMNTLIKDMRRLLVKIVKKVSK